MNAEGGSPQGGPGRDDARGDVARAFRDLYLETVTAVSTGLHDAGFDDLRPAHLVVFQHIRREGSRLVDLAAAAQITPQSMGYLVDALERRGYVRRTDDPRDRRAALIFLTDRGWAQVETALAAIARLEAGWDARLGPERAAELRRALGDLVPRC